MSDMHQPKKLPCGPRIEPVPAGLSRPLISVVIPVFNAADYLEEALNSVLAQDLGPAEMEIMVVDNHSTDNSEAVAREVGGTRVRIHRQSSNVGAIENFNSAIRYARGKWIHILHADDVVLAGFYARARQVIIGHPDIGGFSCRHAFTDADGTWLSLSEPQTRKPGLTDDAFIDRQLIAQKLHFVSLVVQRSAYEKLGGFRSIFRHCADWDMWNRIVLSWPLFFDTAILACNRLHSASDTSHMMITGKNVREERFCIRVASSYLPRRRAKHVFSKGMMAAAKRAGRNAFKYWTGGNKRIALRQFSESVRCLVTAKTFWIFYFLWFFEDGIALTKKRFTLPGHATRPTARSN
jgi:glycosyltransferase involved in cell wall biosynthesis